MLGLDNKERREVFNTIANYIVIIAAALYTLWLGTDFLTRDSKALELGNTKLSVDSIPTASTLISVDKPVTPLKPDDKLCFPAGKYSITNTGKLALTIRSAKIEVYEAPFPVSADGQSSVSRAPEELLKTAELVASQDFDRSETIGVNNSFERLFNWAIPRKKLHYYILVATAEGGLFGIDPDEQSKNADKEAEIRAYTQFGPNDLRHTAMLGPQCT